MPAVCVMVLAVGASVAQAKPTFHPRVRNALGLLPTYGSDDVATGVSSPVVYHGGTVMAGGVTVHTIFWAPAAYGFSSGYEGLVQQFFTDVAADSGDDTNGFSVLPQYGQGRVGQPKTPGAYQITYTTGTNSIDDSQPYPSSGNCASANNAGTCLTDGQVQTEVQRLITADGLPTGLHDLYYVFLPTDVDECIAPGVCGTNAFGGYHSV